MKHDIVHNRNILLAVTGIALVGLVYFFLTPNEPFSENDFGKAFQPTAFSPIENTQSLSLASNETIELSADIIERKIDGKTVYGYGYNKQSPGPLLKVKKGDTLIVDFTNNLDQPTTVHWHGLRLQNKYDGVPDVTQKEVMPGEKFEYVLSFPDAGLFWYHPHVREDSQQERGLYGTILVEDPFDSKNGIREEVVTLDDVLMEGYDLALFDDKETNYAVMGRYGNLMLTNGKTDYSLTVQKNTVLRLYLVNVANARPFNIRIPGAKMKVIGGDVGYYEKPFFQDSVILGPSERVIIDVLFETEGEFEITNDTPISQYKIGKITVREGPEKPPNSFEELNTTTTAMEVEALKPYFDAPVDFDYELLIRWPVMDKMMQNQSMGGGGMMHGNMNGMENEDIEWEDSMAAINSITTNEEITWIIRDAKSKKENMDFYNTVKKGEIKKIRITNLETSSHPMQHPVHLHGNKFLVLSTDGKRNEDLVWKDTVLIPTGKEVELLVEFSNPGDWMIHCHIAEHLSSGMMSMIKVVE
jgi:FtsP/CotA-like multicopper oxidase with cupredoxin domain